MLDLVFDEGVWVSKTRKARREIVRNLLKACTFRYNHCKEFFVRKAWRTAEENNEVDFLQFILIRWNPYA